MPFDLHLYEKGRHGIGLGRKDLDPGKLHPWTRDCSFWLKQQGLVKKARTPQRPAAKVAAGR